MNHLVKSETEAVDYDVWSLLQFSGYLSNAVQYNYMHTDSPLKT